MNEADARAIALAWQPQLQGKVRLVLGRDGPVDSIRESYAWVRIDLPRPLSYHRDERLTRRESIAILRAVMLTWAALASSPGYSGSENPVFWKRVISDLQEPSADEFLGVLDEFLPFDGPNTITDAYGFFDRPSHEFPRFMVDTPGEVDAMFHGLFTGDAFDLVPEVATKLRLHLTQVQAGLNPTRPIDVCLRIRARSSLNKSTAQRLADFVHVVNASSSTMRDKSFRVIDMQLSGGVPFTDDKDIDALCDFVRRVPLCVGHIHLYPYLEKATRVEMSKWIQSALNLDGHGTRAKVTSFEFARHYMQDDVFQALMSALPFARATHSLSFGTRSAQRTGSFERTDLPWIAYAIFHPRTNSSSWRHLQLTDLPFTPTMAYVLSTMARGNNLLQLGQGTVPESDAYYSAELPAGTHVWLEPNESSESFAVGSAKTIDICGINSLDRTAWDEWVAVIVPAYGLGYVHADQLHSVQAHAPSQTVLSGLRLENTWLDGQVVDMPEVLLDVFLVLGASLRYLDIRSCCAITSTTLDQVLRACPQLTALMVSHYGQLWSDLALEAPALETRLEELELSLDPHSPGLAIPSLGRIQRHFQNLRALRLRVTDPAGTQLLQSQAALQLLLVHIPTLQYLHWQNLTPDLVRRGYQNEPIPYNHTQQWTQVALQQLQLTDDCYQYYHEPLNTSCLAAFLSAIACHRDQSALGQLFERAVLMTIFQYAGACLRRTLYIEPYDKADGLFFFETATTDDQPTTDYDCFGQYRPPSEM